MTRATSRIQQSHATRLLAVGDLIPPPDGGADEMAAAEVSYLCFAEVTPERLAEIKPDVVLSPLVGRRFDCLDLAERLARAGFGGKYRAVAATVPDPALVRNEIADRFPMLDFDLLVLEKAG